MKISKIHFNSFLGIRESSRNGYIFELPKAEKYLNHLNTMHASAQFALAEASSGQALLNEFPQYAENVIPVLRKSTLKFSKPAESSIFSKAGISEDQKRKTEIQFDKKGRALIEVKVELFDEDKIKIFSAAFEWFVVLKN